MSETQRSASSLVCPECGGEFTLSDFMDGDDYVTCTNCNRKYFKDDILHKSTEERVEEIRTKAYSDVENERTRAYADVEKDRTQAYRDVEEGKRKIEYERMKHEFEREDKEEREAEAKVFKKSKFRVVLIIATIISVMLCAVAFNDGKIWAGIVAVIMTALFVVSFLMGNNVIKEKRKNLRLIPAIIAFVLFIPCTFLYTGSSTLPSITEPDEEDFVWTELVLSDKLPELPSNYGVVHADSERVLSVTIRNITKSDYTAYKNACINEGYSVDAETSNNNYKAYNAEGYRLSVTYYEQSTFSKEEIKITLDEPVKMTSYKWPSTGIGSKLPALTTEKGKISTNSSDTFTIYVGNVTVDDFNDYVDACLDAGFDVDYSRYDKSFYADNENGDHLTVTYQGYNTIYINLYNWSK